MVKSQTDSGAAAETEDEQDALLLRRIERKEMTAFESLYRRYYGKLSRFVTDLGFMGGGKFYETYGNNDAGDLIATGSKYYPYEAGVLRHNGKPIELGALECDIPDHAMRSAS